MEGMRVCVYANRVNHTDVLVVRRSPTAAHVCMCYVLVHVSVRTVRQNLAVATWEAYHTRLASKQVSISGLFATGPSSHR